MATELTTTQWTEILQDTTLTNKLNIAVFQTLFAFADHKSYASQVGRILGYHGKAPQGPLNLEIGRYAKRIGKHYDINFTSRNKKKYKYWDLFFNGWNEGKFFVWQLRPELTDALIETGLTGDEQFPDEIPTENHARLFEGAKRTITVNAYERNNKARQICIDHYGTTCSVCDFDFEEKYGEQGKGFIHIHHLTPISDISDNHEVDPTKHLIPVCPNCHAMLHRQEPPMTIDELKSLLTE